jgi:hypothetical protein
VKRYNVYRMVIDQGWLCEGGDLDPIETIALVLKLVREGEKMIKIEQIT